MDFWENFNENGKLANIFIQECDISTIIGGKALLHMFEGCTIYTSALEQDIGAANTKEFHKYWFF